MIKEIKQLFFGHKIEESYSLTQIVRSPVKLSVIDAHDLLNYALMRAKVAKIISDIISHDEKSFLIGFLTGSYGLCVNAVLLLNDKISDRYKYVMGLRHHLRLSTSEKEYHDILNSYFYKGYNHIILVDEMISGTQLRTALKSAEKWALGKANSIQVTLIGVHEGSQIQADEICKKVIANKSSWPFKINTNILSVPKLLEKDKSGLYFRAIKLESLGEYKFERAWNGPIQIKCSNAGASGGVAYSSGSADQVFGFLIRSIVDQNKSPSPYVWPETIVNNTCDTCKELFKLSRKTYQEAVDIIKNSSN